MSIPIEFMMGTIVITWIGLEAWNFVNRNGTEQD